MNRTLTNYTGAVVLLRFLKPKKIMMHDKSKEGKATVAVEKKTSRVPSLCYLGAGLGALAVSALLMCRGKKSTSLLVGQWAAPLLIMGLYNKIVKTGGHDGCGCSDR